MAEIHKNLILKNIESIMHDSMMPYSEFVILDRALPRVEDGLKPVQRRILYTMLQLGVTPDQPYRKSARIVGDCLGKYHPHGDTSVYDAMVRMAQPFNMGMPLVDGHGNFGSMDGDSAAAMRYTEARLTPLAMELLKDLEKNTVPFSLNFDDTLQEPDILPAHFPNILINGASGIAVGVATQIPPFNLNEVIDSVICYIDNKNAEDENILKKIYPILKAPDFPTGGYVVASKEELQKIYETGRGKIFLQAKIHIEKAEYDKTAIVITEFPYQVNKADLLQKILELREKKKDEELMNISEIADESDRKGVRAVIKVKRDCDPRPIVDLLLKHTNLRCSYNVNMVAIAEGRPQQMGILDIIAAYVSHKRNVVLNRSKFDLAEAEARAHILEGLVIAVKNIDEVIKIIKKSANTTEARQNLRKRFDLSEKQAQAILDMRLARLTNLEIEKLKEELKELKKLIERLKIIIGSKKEQYNIVKEELSQIKRAYKTDRRSEVVSSFDKIKIEYDEKASSNVIAESQSYVLVTNESKYLKLLTPKGYAQSARNTGVKFSYTDSAINVAGDDKLLIFTKNGACIRLAVSDIPEGRWKDLGASIQSLADVEEEDSIVKVFVANEMPVGRVIFVTRQGMVKATEWKEYECRNAIFQAIKLRLNDEVITVENDNPNKTMFYVTKYGMGLNSEKKDIPTQGRIAGGVAGINLNDNDEVIFAASVEKNTSVVTITNSGFAKNSKTSEFDISVRNRKGLKFNKFNDKTGSFVAFASLYNKDDEIILVDKSNEFSVVNMSEVKESPRDTAGYKLIDKKLVKGYRHRMNIDKN